MSNERLLQEKPIPSHYLPIEKQIEILKALAVFHGKYNKGVTYKEVSSTLGYDKNQVSSSLKFWKDIGLLAADKATYIPTSTTKRMKGLNLCKNLRKITGLCSLLALETSIASLTRKNLDSLASVKPNCSEASNARFA